MPSPAAPLGRDPALQLSPGTGIPTPSVSFDGLSQADNNAVFGFGVLPPDTDGDIGPNHYVEWINLVFGVYDKTGTKLLGPIKGSSLWLGEVPPTACSAPDDKGDPIVLYDQLADRWMISQFAFVGTGDVGPYYLCLAVSATPNPTGAWCTYSFNVHNLNFPDYPKYGMWPEAYYATVVQFDAVGYRGPAAIAFERQKMLDCQTARFHYVDLNDTTSTRMLPTDLDGSAPPPAGTPNFLLRHVDDTANVNDRLELFKFQVDWSTTPSTHTLVGPTPIPVPAFETSFACGTGRQCVPQPATAVKLDLLINRLMFRAAYRNFGSSPPPGVPANTESLVVNQTVDATGADRAGVRWYEIRDPAGTPAAYQAGTFSPDTDHRWMGSAAMDRKGNLAVGYSVGSATTFPSIRYAGRLVGDPLNQLSQGEETLHAGTGSQTHSSSRWGDYTFLSVDPSDDCTFWYVNEYLAATSSSSWRTRIGAFKFNECTPPTATMVASFGARWRGSSIRVSWRTASEVDAVGFHVFRSTGSGPFRRVNRAPIPAKRAGQAGGASYRFVDSRVRRGLTYTYRLQTVAPDGKRTWYGLGSAAAQS